MALAGISARTASAGGGVSVVGMGVVSALGVGVQENLSALRGGRSGIAPAPRHVLSSVVLPVGEVPFSDDELRGLCGGDFRPLSRTALLGFLAAREAVGMARLSEGERRRAVFVSSTTVGGMDVTPLFVGAEMSGCHGRLRHVREHDCSAATEAIGDALGLGGPRTTISTACSSGANAIMLGCRLLRMGMADIVVAGGADALCDFTLCGFRSLMILSEEACRPLSEERSGLNLGEGAAYVVLMRDGATGEGRVPLARLLGWGNANDAYHQTAPSADGAGVGMAVRKALSVAGMTPEEVDHVNLHGTATPGNDPSELAAMASVFGERMPSLTSTKGFTGHTLAAAGAVEAVFSSLSLREQTEWPTLRSGTPIGGERFAPVREVRPARLRTVLSTSLGFGGNASALIVGME